MLITNANAPIYPQDKILNWTLIRFLPRQLHPNHVTWLRFFLIPFVLWYIATENWIIGVPLFIFAAFTDALDGSMARVRKQITMWGTFYDPAADKLLIGSVVVLFVAREVNLLFALSIVAVELMILGSGVLRQRRRRLISANWSGKLKMLLQVIGVSTLLIAKWSGLAFLIPAAVFILALSILFAVVSLLTYSL